MDAALGAAEARGIQRFHPDPGRYRAMVPARPR
jgi:hypothetical protein